LDDAISGSPKATGVETGSEIYSAHYSSRKSTLGEGLEIFKLSRQHEYIVAGRTGFQMFQIASETGLNSRLLDCRLLDCRLLDCRLVGFSTSL
jgi:hypothetical protein